MKFYKIKKSQWTHMKVLKTTRRNSLLQSRSESLLTLKTLVLDLPWQEGIVTTLPQVGWVLGAHASDN